MDQAAIEAEWNRLVAERRALRREVADAIDDITARAHDPFGMASRVREHPLLSAGLAAGAGAVFGLLKARSRASGRGGLGAGLVDLAIRTFAPWLPRARRAGHEGDPPKRSARDDALEHPNGR